LESALEFGIFTGFNTREGHSEAEAFDEWLNIALVAEEVGIDTFWLAEFHFRPRTILSAPMAVASAIAAQTTRMKLGMAVALLPLANPVRLAEEAATVDHLSKGRFVFGVGRSSFVDGYRGYNVDYAESRPMFLEALEIIRRAWAPGPFSFEGKYFQFTDVNVVPKPYHQPHPPIRIACESKDTFGLMGRLGFPIFIRHQMDIPVLQELLARYEEDRHAAGYSGPNDVILQVSAYLAESESEARADTETGIIAERQRAIEFAKNTGDDEAFHRLTRLSSLSYEELVQRPGLDVYPNPNLFGTPQMLVEILKEYQEKLGITGVSLAMNPGLISEEKVLKSMRLLGERVIPRFA
jgi:alkanesulfonate monooxygenase SsuD/methylene tetrahydromethanopterin reductase-like flavin-dependent oxidoreductase (luciferase family)